jgi:hypothetical protein
MTAGAKAALDVAALVRARNPLIMVISREEVRVERYIAPPLASLGYEPRFWDCATGVSNLTGEPCQPGGEDAKDPLQVLEAIRNTRQRQVWILRDLPPFFRDPVTVRYVRSLVRGLTNSPRDEARSLILITPTGDIPPELAGHAVVVEWPLPDRAEVSGVLDVVISAQPEDRQEAVAPNGTRDRAIDAAVGLSEEEIQACFGKSLVQTGKIDPVAVAQEKKRVIARERVLEWFDPLPGGLESVGGLDLMKLWLLQRRDGFSAKARAYGLPPPKGVLLVGVSGCGKSLTAKAIATAYGGLPLLRLDLGGLKSKYVGDSEANIRKALKVAEAVSPCVVWVDEIEKALAGATQGAADGGVSGDALGTLLSWMQERQGSVFVIATANDVRTLPPELLRKGRFDEVFWIDLPTKEERKAVISAAIRQYRAKAEVDLNAIAAATQDFTGAEIAALVPEAMFTAYSDGERAVTSADLLAAAKNTVPLAKTAGPKIEELRAWAKGRARPATTPEASGITATPGRKLDL